MGKIVVVAYQPHKGKEAELISLVKEHIPVLKKEGLVTDRKPVVMQATDNTIIEVFEWKSKEAINAAHYNPQVQAHWSRFSEVCEYKPAGSVREFSDLFSEFEAVM